MRVCYSRLGKKRPAAFATTDETGLVLINYKRKNS
jgi:hypothetical protein